jgi:uncharacterized protein with HEPN domain
LFSSVKARDEVLHPYRTTEKNIVWHIVMFDLLDTSLGDRRFRAEW